MKVIVLTHTIKETMPIYPGTELLKLQYSKHSPIRAITQFEHK